ncbi:hypothetical protein U9M48_041834 [Paspalum notatum var. saurae]|uniref:Uncharacterized protein n=1 Tax=Paspalum notatum var. saurae TaxID=547442 RepID=A0AAQ3XEM1_PASNO
MATPFRPSPPAASAPGGCGGDRCASGRDAWPLHHFRHEGVFCLLCSSCVLLYSPTTLCSACIHLLPTSPAAATAAPGDPAVAPPGPTVPCSTCGLSVAHLSCLQGDPASFVCPPCAAAAEGRAFSFTPAPAGGGGGRRVISLRDARVLLVAARLANDSVTRAAAAAREEAERCVAEAAAARKRAREMLDAAFRQLEAEARDAAKMSPPPPPPAPAPAPAFGPAPAPKKKTAKSTEATRDKMPKFNNTQPPAVAYAAVAAAAAAATSMPLPTPSSREDKTPVKQEPQAPAPLQREDRPAPPQREDRPPLFGALES